MKVDAFLGHETKKTSNLAQDFEKMGYDGVFAAEMSHDPFLQTALASERTNNVDLYTSVAVAFARNPMTLANLGHDLNTNSHGRFMMGIGSQIEPHITKRFSMPWSKPASRMKELIQAIHAIWDCWYEEKALSFRGEFYTHTIMTPMFTPTDIEQQRPKILLAAVGPKMTEVAATVADGMIVHAFTTLRHLTSVTIPMIEKTLAAENRSKQEFQIVFPVNAVTADTEENFQEILSATRKQIAFYGSTPAYKGVLDLHGWGDLQPELNRLSKLGRWNDMADLVTDDVLQEFAVVGEPQEIVETIRRKYTGYVDRVQLQLPAIDASRVPTLIEGVKS